MKCHKKIMIWGSHLFTGLTLSDDKNKYVYLSSSCIMQLESKYDIYNYSSASMSSSKAANYLKKALAFYNKYDFAIIELGYVDLKQILTNEISLADFANNLSFIINILKKADIKPFLSTILPINFRQFILKNNISVEEKCVSVTYKKINRIIRTIAQENTVELIDDSKALGKNKTMYFLPNGISLTEKGESLIKNMIYRKI